ncbi:hypothetical protein [Gluconobacter sp. Gdi]|uniref:hypothetical protein n=1 Tax=Gluconobacter sp. Gdi TaxID=2691888 RepID=UPI001769F208|nr:hypothetical protein [Gluconobacter sp. Gdi]GFE97847.1 hypothetical protein DmGdi_29200 [Gluconobacter sp. Gdi]
MQRYQFPYVPTLRGRPPMRWTDTQEPTTCRRCNTHWEEGDPALTIACAGCGAPADEPCRRRSGGNERVCACRDEAAVQRGFSNGATA